MTLYVICPYRVYHSFMITMLQLIISCTMIHNQTDLLDALVDGAHVARLDLVAQGDVLGVQHQAPGPGDPDPLQEAHHIVHTTIDDIVVFHLLLLKLCQLLMGLFLGLLLCLKLSLL